MRDEMFEFVLHVGQRRERPTMTGELFEDVHEFLSKMIGLVRMNKSIEGLIFNSTASPSENPHLLSALEYLSTESRAEFHETLGMVVEELRTAFDDHRSRTATITSNDAEASALLGRLLRLGFRSVKAPREDAVLRRSILTVAISEYELLLGRAVAYALRAQPDAMQSEHKSVTLAQLGTYDSIEDCVSGMIEKQVEELMRGSFDDWSAWLQGKFDVRLEKTVDDTQKIAEMYARRNIAVHNDQVVNHQYLKRASLENVETLAAQSLGKRLEISEEYLDESVQRLMSMGVLLALSVCLKLERQESSEAVSWTVHATDVLLDSACFSSVTNIAATARRECSKHLERLPNLDLMVNNWVARREIGQAGEVESEASEWDVSGLDEYFVMAKEILRGDLNAAVRATVDALTAGRITRTAVAADVLYSQVRSSDSVAAALRSEGAG